MLRDYSLSIDEPQLAQLAREEKWPDAFEMLAAPLHEWLYEVQDFEALDSRPAIEQLVLSFDYVQTQVGQGGFIQLIQNGYAGLLVTVIESLQSLQIAPGMIPVLDDALKVFVLNNESLGRETSVTAFSKLYGEFTEFEILETNFGRLQASLMKEVVMYVCPDCTLLFPDEYRLTG